MPAFLRADIAQRAGLDQLGARHLNGTDTTSDLGGDDILSIEILDPIDALMTAQAERVAEWNKKMGW